MYDITENNASDFDFALSDGTPVTFVKITSKNNIQVRIPEGHDLAYDQDNGRIFRRDGSHYKDEYDVTLTATPKLNAAPAPIQGGNLVVIDNDVYSLTYVGTLHPLF